jgi:hypothetical protein
MMVQGSAVIGFLILVAWGWEYGVNAVALITLALLFDLLVGHGFRSVQRFRYLEHIEQALQQASHGFALMVFALLLAVVPYAALYGWQALYALGRGYLTHPADAWPLAPLGFMFLVGLVLFRAGVRRSAGVRDDIRRPRGVLRFIVGAVVVGYLAWTYPWGELAASLPVLLCILVAFVGGLWIALTGLMRVLLLSLPQRSARGDVEDDIAAHEFHWDE